MKKKQKTKSCPKPERQHATSKQRSAQKVLKHWKEPRNSNVQTFTGGPDCSSPESRARAADEEPALPASNRKPQPRLRDTPDADAEQRVFAVSHNTRQVQRIIHIARAVTAKCAHARTPDEWLAAAARDGRTDAGRIIGTTESEPRKTEQLTSERALLNTCDSMLGNAFKLCVCSHTLLVLFFLFFFFRLFVNLTQLC